MGQIRQIGVFSPAQQSDWRVTESDTLMDEPAQTQVRIKIVEHEALTPQQREVIVALCGRAYEEEFADFFAALPGAVHLLLYEDDLLASHVCWVERRLQQAGREPVRTAYVEAVATEPGMQGKGYATRLMQELAERIQVYPFAFLSPADTTLYTRLGWLPWRGPLFVRTPNGLEAAPDEHALYLPTHATPEWLNPDDPLSCEWRDAPEQW